MLSTKKILSVGVGIASMAGVMAMSTAPVAAAEGTIEVVTHAGAGGGTDVNSRMMMIRTRRHLKQDMVVVNKRGGGRDRSRGHRHDAGHRRNADAD